MPGILATIGPAITKFAGTTLGKAIGSVGSTVLASKLAMNQNKKLAQYSHNKNIEMWKMQNEYNTPAQQMARFKAAGLNPNMIYDKGTAGNAQTMPQYQSLPTSGDVFGQSVAGLQGLLNIEKTKEDIYSAERENWVQDNFAELRVLTAEVEYDRAIINAKKEKFEEQAAKSTAYIKDIEARLASSGLTLRDAVWLRAGAMVLSGIDESLPVLGPLKKTFAQFFNVFDLELEDIKEYQPGALKEFIIEPGKRTKWKFKR